MPSKLNIYLNGLMAKGRQFNFEILKFCVNRHFKLSAKWE